MLTLFSATKQLSGQFDVAVLSEFTDELGLGMLSHVQTFHVGLGHAPGCSRTAGAFFLALGSLIHISRPIVFGVLPLTVIFAVFPGLSLLEMSY